MKRHWQNVCVVLIQLTVVLWPPPHRKAPHGLTQHNNSIQIYTERKNEREQQNQDTAKTKRALQSPHCDSSLCFNGQIEIETGKTDRQRQKLPGYLFSIKMEPNLSSQLQQLYLSFSIPQTGCLGVSSPNSLVMMRLCSAIYLTDQRTLFELLQLATTTTLPHSASPTLFTLLQLDQWLYLSVGNALCFALISLLFSKNHWLLLLLLCQSVQCQRDQTGATCKYRRLCPHTFKQIQQHPSVSSGLSCQWRRFARCGHFEIHGQNRDNLFDVATLKRVMLYLNSTWRRRAHSRQVGRV